MAEADDIVLNAGPASTQTTDLPFTNRFDITSPGPNERIERLETEATAAKPPTAPHQSARIAPGVITARAAELIGVGRQLIAMIDGLDDHLSNRLVNTDRLIARAQVATRATTEAQRLSGWP